MDVNWHRLRDRDSGHVLADCVSLRLMSTRATYCSPTCIVPHPRLNIIASEILSGCGAKDVCVHAVCVAYVAAGMHWISRDLFPWRPNLRLQLLCDITSRGVLCSQRVSLACPGLLAARMSMFNSSPRTPCLLSGRVHCIYWRVTSSPLSRTPT